MIIRKGCVFRLKPSKLQQNKLQTCVGHTRFVYNHFSAIQKHNYDNHLKLLSYSKLCKELTSLKNSSEFLYDAPSQSLQQGLKDLTEAISRHFDSLKKHKKDLNYEIVSFPGFRKKFTNDSFRFTSGFIIDQINSRILLPKLGWIKYRNSRKITGIPKNVTVSRNLNSWDISIQTEEEVPDQIHPNISNVIGLDLGVKNLITTSEGNYIKPINSYQQSQDKISKLNQALAKKKKGSIRRTHVLKKLQKAYKKSSNVRKDFINKITTLLSKNHGTIVIEDLNISRMLQNGTAELNKWILDQGWYEIKRQLKYKLLWLGGNLIEINPAYTSQMCNACGLIDSKSRVTRDNFLCVGCGNADCADLNAAKNIELKGSFELLAVGQTVNSALVTCVTAINS